MSNVSKANTLSITVASAKTATLGYGCLLTAAGATCEDASTNGNVSGVFVETGAAGAVVTYAVSGVVKAKVGTGGATDGSYAIHTTDGWTDQVIGGGTTVKYIGGKFLADGVAGDLVDFLVAPFAAGSA